MFLVPADTVGVDIVRNLGLHGERDNGGLTCAITTTTCGSARGAAGRRGQVVRDRQTRWARTNSPNACAPIGLSRRAGHDVRARAHRDTRARRSASILCRAHADSYASCCSSGFMVLLHRGDR